MPPEFVTPETIEVQTLARSCNEALILAVLSDGPFHGYQLALELEERSDGGFRFAHGTLYPILHKLERDGLIRGDWSDAGGRRKRKSYTLTRTGHEHLAKLTVAWRDFTHRFFAVVGEEER